MKRIVNKLIYGSQSFTVALFALIVAIGTVLAILAFYSLLLDYAAGGPLSS